MLSNFDAFEFIRLRHALKFSFFSQFCLKTAGMAGLTNKELFDAMNDYPVISNVATDYENQVSSRR